MPEIKNLKKAAERIAKAAKNKENIVLYGDADLDGVTSVIILKESIKNLGGKISAVYFPNREAEGYGISEIGLNFFKGCAPGLLIAMDCGISNFKEVELAKRLGFEVVILDHHEVLDKLPKTKIIVDPKQKGDKSNSRSLAAAGIIFKLSEVLLKDKMTESLRKNFLELTALATLADMMPQERDNKVFISEGLMSIDNSWRPGIKAFFESEFLSDFSGIQQKVSKIISILNVRDIEERLPASFRLLSAVSLEEAEKLIKKLLVKSRIRKEGVERVVAEIEERAAVKDEKIIFEGDVSFETEFLGTTASIISQRLQKPTFLYKKMAEESLGTVRVPEGVDSVALMKKCSKLLLTFGGHAKASGFRLKNENLEKFKECLLKNFKQRI